MKTLDYIQLDAKKVENVVTGLQHLLADFQEIGRAAFIGTSRANRFSYCIVSLRRCTMIRQRKSTRLPNAS